MKKCHACQTNPVAHFETRRCWTCRGEEDALARTERDTWRSQELKRYYAEANRLRDEADRAFETLKQEFLDFERNTI
jgi:hypothetical protein